MPICGDTMNWGLVDNIQGLDLKNVSLEKKLSLKYTEIKLTSAHKYGLL
jgi:hypothetical protein